MRKRELYLPLLLSMLLFHETVSGAIGATVSGQVRAALPPFEAVAGARMTLFTPSLSFFAEARSDASGSYSIPGVPEGTYLLGCAKMRRDYVQQSVVVGASGLQVDFDLETESHPGQWDIIGTTAPEFLDATDIGILLSNGQIFYCHDTTDPILFDPATGTRSFPSGSPSQQGCQNGTLMSEGQVLMMGGQSPANPGAFTNAVPWTKVWNPGASSWQLLPDMQHGVGRWYPGLARLADGSVLVMGGGQCCDAARTDSCERFNLENQTWTYTGSMVNPTEFPPAALLHTGEVLATWWPPQLYNPTSGTWRLTGNFNQPNRLWPGHSDHSLVVLDDGRALAIGIVSGPGNNSVMAESFDPLTETWSLLSNPELIRFQCEVVQLPDGRVFVGGGETESSPSPVDDVLGIVRWCDLYDPVFDEWRRVADMTWHREYHAVTLLVPDGRVVTTGGTRIKFQVGPTSAEIEAFSPPYLFRGVRPQIAGISSSSLPRGSQVSMDLEFETQLTHVVLVGTQTTTHWVDGGIPRRIVLPVQQRGLNVTLNLPSDPNVLPLGHYMLFAMIDDIPSVARIVSVVEADGPSTGACCDPIGGCTIETQADCVGGGNEYLGDAIACGADGVCPANCWTCECLDGFLGSGESADCVGGEIACNNLCIGHTGVQGFTCNSGLCPESVPTISHWAQMILFMFVLAAGTVIFRSRMIKRSVLK